MRPEKKFLSIEIQEWLEGSAYILFVAYSGLRAEEFRELRQRLASVGARCRVAKNQALTRILRESRRLPEEWTLKGQVAAIAHGDMIAASKILKNFVAEFTRPKLLGGLLDDRTLSAAEAAALAELPSREELLGKLLGLLQAPATRLVSVLSEPSRALARTLAAHEKQQEGAAAT
ncbi:50S ribosomal protein L10 [Methylacidimicrobium cyclopophantes]|uniref:Large ribosomal subunit protein uL10 n=1 Tax=Methylacidimicrobium cyclopophantes TaxID=1041766 RepID=A0A5E6MDD5_9BACT|nr:50S ribosomal protein L10 [Methylacidimicrobium cyclopophantes]VVM07222.1 50S ribosomal protein L10 [Methylacidimicrobium cyclopophantes]